MKRVLLIFFVMLLCSTRVHAQLVPQFNYAADDYGGLLSVPCSPNPHAVTITSASQTGTVQTVVVSSVANFGINEAMLISGTSTAMDWVYTANNPTDGASYITAINAGTKTLTLTATVITHSGDSDNGNYDSWPILYPDV